MAELETAGQLRGARRTIAVIKALNLRDTATVSEISRIAGISRQAVYRILGTLIEEGLVSRPPGSERYRLELGIRSLSDGFRDEDWVLNIAAPIIDKLQKTTVWPTNFATFNGRSMVIRHTSRPASPLVIDNATIGVTLPVLETAMGLAFLAWSQPAELREILSTFRDLDEGDGVNPQLKTLAKTLEATRTRGYATRPGNFMPETRSMAVPVLLNGRCVGSIAVTYFKSACLQSEAVDLYLPSLLSAQAELHTRLQAENVQI